MIAASTRHEVSGSNTAIGHVDVGSTYVLPPTLTLQYHFRLHARLIPYADAGTSVACFYDTSPAGPTITKVGVKTTIGPTIEVGLDYNVAGKRFLNADVEQMVFSTRARIIGGSDLGEHVTGTDARRRQRRLALLVPV